MTTHENPDITRRKKRVAAARAKSKAADSRPPSKPRPNAALAYDTMRALVATFRPPGVKRRPLEVLTRFQDGLWWTRLKVARSDFFESAEGVGATPDDAVFSLAESVRELARGAAAEVDDLFENRPDDLLRPPRRAYSSRKPAGKPAERRR